MKWWHAALIIAVLVIGISPFASSSPDGLEKVAEDKGFLGLAGSSPFEIIADYVFPGVHNESMATILAGILGTVVVFGLVFGVSWVIRSRRRQGAG